MSGEAHAVLSVLLAALLVWLFAKTRNVGYLVLTIAFPGWWFVSFFGGQFIFRQADMLREGEPLSFPFSLISDPKLPDIMQGFAVISYAQLLLVFVGFLLLAIEIRRQSTSLQEETVSAQTGLSEREIKP